MIRIYLFKAYILHLVWAALSSIAEKAGDHADVQVDTAIDLARDKVQKRIDALEAEAKYATGVVNHWAGVAVDKGLEAAELRDSFEHEVDKLLG